MVTRVAVTTGAPASAAAFAPTLPTHAAGDRLALFVLGKYDTTTVPTINQGWTLVGSGTGGTGAQAADTGPVFWACYAKDAVSGAETAPTVTPGATAPDSWEWIAASHRPGVGKLWKDPIAASAPWVRSANDTTLATPLTGTATSWGAGNFPTAGDAIFCTGNIPTDLGTGEGSTTVTNTGLSGGTVTIGSTQYVENALGNDSAAVWAGWTGFTGTASAGCVMSFTITSAGSNQAGALVALALRETPDPAQPVPPTILWENDLTTWTGTGGTSRSVTFVGTAGDWLTLIAATEGVTADWAAPTNDGAALTWVATTGMPFDPGGNTQNMLGVWQAQLDTSRTITVDANSVAAITGQWGAGLLVARGSDGFGASSATNNGTGSGAPTLGLTTTGNLSAIGAVCVDWNATAGARTYTTVNSSAPTEHFQGGQASTTYLVEVFSYADAGLAGAKTVGMSAPGGQRYVIAAFELKGLSTVARLRNIRAANPATIRSFSR